MNHVTSPDGTQIAYDKAGSGPAIILVDGALGYRAYHGNGPLAAQLAAEFTTITFDRRGRGDSTSTLPYAVQREIEDIAALVATVERPVYLFGFSSGSVLALRAAAALGDQIAKLALVEPPLNSAGDEDIRASAEAAAQIEVLLAAGDRSGAVAAFLGDMMPPDMLEEIKSSPDWALMESVAPTLAYDNMVMGDGTIPAEAKEVMVPTLIIDGGESPDFKHEAADALANAMPNATRQTVAGQSTQIAPEILAPVLTKFFNDKEV